MLHELEHPCPPTIISRSTLNVCCWHKADILAKLLARGEAPRIAANIAMSPELLRD
jgi:hypothetical protein